MGRELRPAHSADAGFSLIELLVVIAVMGVLAVGVTLTPLSRSAPSDMARFKEMFDGTRAQAISAREIRGLEITPQYMAQVRLGGAGWTPGREQPWRGRVAFRRHGGVVPVDAPAIRFLPDGRSEAFSITFGTEGRCESDGWTGVTCRES